MLHYLGARKDLIIKTILTAMLLIVAVGGRVFYLQTDHYREAERYYSEQNYKLAIREYDTAMHFYLPFSPYIERSANRLWEMGEMFEKADKPDWANIAYSSIRSSFYASRSLYTPGIEWINKCDEKIAGLNVKMLLTDGSITPEEAEVEKERHLYVLKTDRAPKPGWALLAGASFLGWVGSALYIIYIGLNAQKHLLYGGVSFALCFLIWALALLRA